MTRSITGGIAALTSAIALAACGGGAVDADADGDGEVTQEEAQSAVEQAGAQIKPEAGQYRATMTFVDAELPGAPPEIVEMMGSVSGNTFEFCMTPEMADAGYGETMRENQDDSCKIDRMNINGNDMDMAMSCNDPDMGSMTVAMTGTVTSTSSNMTVISEGVFGPMGEGRMEMKLEQERIGDCDS